MGRRKEEELFPQERKGHYDAIREKILRKMMQDMVLQYRDDEEDRPEANDSNENLEENWESGEDDDDIMLTEEELQQWRMDPTKLQQDESSGKVSHTKKEKLRKSQQTKQERKKKALDRLMQQIREVNEGIFTIENPKLSHEKRDFTLSVAIPSSILHGMKSQQLMTNTVGRIARLCNNYRVDEIVVYNDEDVNFRIEQTKFLKNMRPNKVDMWGTRAELTGAAEGLFNKGRENRQQEELEKQRKKVSTLIPDRLKAKAKWKWNRDTGADVKKNEDDMDEDEKELHALKHERFQVKSVQPHEIDTAAMKQYTDVDEQNSTTFEMGMDDDQRKLMNDFRQMKDERNATSSVRGAGAGAASKKRHAEDRSHHKQQQQQMGKNAAANIFGVNHNALFIANVLYYMETPPYLRSFMFPVLDFLRHAAVLHPLNSPHHQMGDEVGKYREGIVTDEGNSIFVGLSRLVIIDQKLQPGTRVTVQMMRTYINYYYGQLVPRRAPKAYFGTHWGYDVRVADSIADVLEESPYQAGYDLVLAHSDDAKSISNPKFQIPRFAHALIMLEGPGGLSEAVKCDPRCSSINPRKLVNKAINLMPHRGTSMLRTEEVMNLALASLHPYILKNIPPRPENRRKTKYLPFESNTL